MRSQWRSRLTLRSDSQRGSARTPDASGGERGAWGIVRDHPRICLAATLGGKGFAQSVTRRDVGAARRRRSRAGPRRPAIGSPDTSAVLLPLPHTQLWSEHGGLNRGAAVAFHLALALAFPPRSQPRGKLHGPRLPLRRLRQHSIRCLRRRVGCDGLQRHLRRHTGVPLDLRQRDGRPRRNPRR